MVVSPNVRIFSQIKNDVMTQIVRNFFLLLPFFFQVDTAFEIIRCEKCGSRFQRDPDSLLFVTETDVFVQGMLKGEVSLYH